MPDLSIIILTYNTKNTSEKVLNTLIKSLKSSSINSEIIIVDNFSTDGTVDMLKKISLEEYSNIRINTIYNKKNLGYGKGNNQGLKIAKSDNILFLNSDVIIKNINWEDLLNYFKKNNQIGVLTVRVELPNGQIDPASHRGFPTIWSSFTYFSKLENLFSHIPYLNFLFGGYHLKHLNLSEIHEIDSPSGAFYLTRKNILDKVRGFDDDTFFLYGEDLDLSFRIKDLGFKIIYFPKYEVVHLKSVSGLKKEDQKIKKESKKHFYNAMIKFYDKHYQNKYPRFIRTALIYFVKFKINSK